MVRGGRHRRTRRLGWLTAAAAASAVTAATLSTGPAGAASGDQYYLVLSPASTSVTAGSGQAYTATAYDTSGHDYGDVTRYTTFSIAPDGSCTGAVCTPASVGPHTVTGIVYYGYQHTPIAQGTASLTATTQLSRLSISPAVYTIATGGSATFQAEGYSSTGADLGDETGATTFSIAPDGSCTGAVCSAATAGPHTVTATLDGVSATASVTVTAAKFVELIFSRTDVTGADNCVSDDADVARLDTTVEPFLASLHLAATGSLETAKTQQSGTWCSHNGRTESASWVTAAQLAGAGWTFVSHSADYPGASVWPTLSSGQLWDETCGSAQDIYNHGLPGGDTMFLWPNNAVYTPALTQFVEPCFATSRTYGMGVTSVTQVENPPYEQSVLGLAGGSCNVSTAACASVPGAVTKYRTPGWIIKQIQNLQPGQVLALQSYLNVTGTNPPYSTSSDRWDCTSSNPLLHWTNDAERYCWSDLQTVLRYLASSGIGITQPGAVDAVFGRTGFNGHAVKRPSS